LTTTGDQPARRLTVHLAHGHPRPVRQGGEGQWEVVLAASILAALPMIAIFFLGQRSFVEGIAITGRKG
jgi:ABC-type glycerol-3-phosphate transport system permease component